LCRPAPLEITLKEDYKGGLLVGKVDVEVNWTGEWEYRFPQFGKYSSGSVTGTGNVTVSGFLDPKKPEEVIIMLEPGSFLDHKVQPFPKLVYPILSHVNMLYGAVFDAEQKGLGKFKAQGDSVTISASGTQLGYVARSYLWSTGSYSITANVRPVSVR
jgi:hypothetical protein